MQIEYALATIAASRQQPGANEDAAVAFEGDETVDWRGAVCIADGLATLSDSSAVSLAATSTIPPSLQHSSAIQIAIGWAQAANASIGSRFDSTRVGTTFSGLLIFEYSYAITWVGDCRVYRIKRAAVELLTTDDTRLCHLLGRPPTRLEVREGGDTARRLTKWLDGADRRDDYYNVVGGQIDGDETFVLASDGLWTEVEPEALLPLRTAERLQDAIDALVQHAWALDPTDDITCAAVRLRVT